MNAGVPLFIVVVLSLLMVQLRSFSRMAMVFLTAPLGLIGVTLFLLLFRQPFGFVAMLGTIALARHDHAQLGDPGGPDRTGHQPWTGSLARHHRGYRAAFPAHRADRAGGGAGDDPAVAQRVLRPMAVAIMGGLIVATVLTLLFLPALYAAWFRVKKDEARA